MKDIPRADFIINNRVNPVWQRWLTELKTAVDEVRQEPYVVWTSDTNLTQHHLGRVNIFDIGASDVNVYLPSVDDTDLYKWVRLVRIGTGRLLVWAADDDQIEYSSQPGRIWCNEQKRTAANLELQLVEVNKWAILAGTGIWKVA